MGLVHFVKKEQEYYYYFLRTTQKPYELLLILYIFFFYLTNEEIFHTSDLNKTTHGKLINKRNSQFNLEKNNVGIYFYRIPENRRFLCARPHGAAVANRHSMFASPARRHPPPFERPRSQNQAKHASLLHVGSLPSSPRAPAPRVRCRFGCAAPACLLPPARSHPSPPRRRGGDGGGGGRRLRTQLFRSSMKFGQGRIPEVFAQVSPINIPGGVPF